ncbi:host specificity protein J [Escherichia coli]|nr:host specificity protein J [Escherichia coli]OZP16359.1 host specificity protein J [Escherichia coli]
MGKGSSKGHTPREAKDNLKTTQLLSVIDAISEGPIEGPVEGLKSVLLNSTPVLDSEGNTNISGVTVVFRAGEQEQTPPEGFESSGSETVLGTEVKYDTPITRAITSQTSTDCALPSVCRHWWKPPQRGTGIRRKFACWFRYSVMVAG